MSDEIQNDGLVLPEVGPWAKRKYHFLARYLHLFSTGMKNKWPERHYIDLFASAGFAQIEGSNKILMSSACIAANVPDKFTRIHCCELDPELFGALGSRLARFPQPTPPKLHNGDANKQIGTILDYVPDRGALCVTFVDPCKLSDLSFGTIRAIANKRSDLIILLPDSMDALRNWYAYYLNSPNSSLDRFMGSRGWRQVLLKAPEDRRVECLNQYYQDQLRSLGYKFFARKRVHNTHGVAIYSLVYASQSKVGLQFWDKASAVDEGGQHELWGH